MDCAAALGRAGGARSGHTLVNSIRIVVDSGLMMLPLACASAELSLCFSASWSSAQQGLVNCEAFSSGFTTPEGCIDGSQPSSGPTPADQTVADDDWAEMPFGWYGPGDWMDF